MLPLNVTYDISHEQSMKILFCRRRYVFVGEYEDIMNIRMMLGFLFMRKGNMVEVDDFSHKKTVLNASFLPSNPTDGGIQQARLRLYRQLLYRINGWTTHRNFMSQYAFWLLDPVVKSIC